jgi:sterol desaturase/sphingolipid hydroxylase (fatty acid hydroxylase superfamily)
MRTMGLERLTTYWVSAGILVVTFAAMALAETLLPLRRQIESRLRRTVRNLTTGALSLAMVTLLQAPVLMPLVRWQESHGIGLLNLTRWPPAIELAVAFLLFDYTLWHWHRINHVVPFFWRFHLVHHVDRDMDASTALRFHFGEQGLSVGWRILQVLAIGPSPAAMWIWHALLVVSILFHHSNTRLPVLLERILVRLVVTPRMHGIHHSDWRNETDSNWSSTLSVWDYLHGTTLLSVPQDSVVVGVPAYRAPEDVTIGKLLWMPFRRQRTDWTGPEGPQFERSHPEGKIDLAP